MPHVSPAHRRPAPRSRVDETTLPAASGRRLLLRALPALAVAIGVVGVQLARDDRRERDAPAALTAAERSTRALLNERAAAHLRALRPR
jgi:hypothetical protein